MIEIIYQEKVLLKKFGNQKYQSTFPNEHNVIYFWVNLLNLADEVNTVLMQSAS